MKGKQKEWLMDDKKRGLGQGPRGTLSTATLIKKP